MKNKVNFDRLIEDKYKKKPNQKSIIQYANEELDRLLEAYPGYQYHSNYNYIMDEDEEQAVVVPRDAYDPRNPISAASHDETQPSVGAGLANKPAFSGVGMFEEQEIDEVVHKTVPELTQLNKELEALQSTGNLPEFVIVPISGYRLKVVTDTDVNRNALVASPEIQSLLSSHSMNKGTGHTHIYSKSIGKTKTGKDVKATILFKTTESTARTGSRKEEELAASLQANIFKITGIQQAELKTAGSSNAIDVPLVVNNTTYNIEVKTQGGADFGQFTVIYDITNKNYNINKNSTTYKRAESTDKSLKDIIDGLWAKYRGKFSAEVDQSADIKKYANINKPSPKVKQPGAIETGIIQKTPDEQTKEETSIIQKIPDKQSKEELKTIMLGGSEALFAEVSTDDIASIAKYYATKNDFMVVDTYLYKLKDFGPDFADIPYLQDSIKSCSIRLRFKAHRTDGPWDITASFKIKLDNSPSKRYSLSPYESNDRGLEFIKKLLKHSQSSQQKLEETKSFNKIKVILR